MSELTAMAASLLLSAGLMPLVILFCKRYSLFDPVTARKIHSGNIPRLGGIGIVIPAALGLAIYQLASHRLDVHWLLIGGGGLIFLFCILDDLFDLPAVLKLVVQIVATVMAVCSGCQIGGLFGIPLPAACRMILTICWILGVTNAYNLIDGLDGLCGGLTFLTLLTVGLIQMQLGNASGIVCLCIAAATMGFLFYNWPNAKIFMGDCGSQFLGFMVATLPFAPPFLPPATSFEHNKFLIMLVLASIPMTDTIAAIWRRVRDHRSILSPDRMHLHHKLLNMGVSKQGTLYVLLLLQTLLCLSVFSAAHMGILSGACLLAVAYVFMLFLFGVLHYIHRAVLKKRGQWGEPIAQKEQP